MTNVAVESPAFETRGLTAGYNGKPVLLDVSFQVPRGGFMGIIGPNGSGKSTLLKVALGLLKPWEGSVLFFGREGGVQRGEVGYMPQVELVDWDFPVTVGDVAIMGRYAGLGLLRRPSAADREAADRALSQVDMLDHHGVLIGELSGGQRRRVLLARAMASDPRLLLLDEPMVGLDAAAQHHLLDVFANLRTQGTTVVMSSHDLSCVSTACDSVCCLRGRVVALGKPHEVLTEEVLSETFGAHLLTVHLDGKTYAHQHQDSAGAKE